MKASRSFSARANCARAVRGGRALADAGSAKVETSNTAAQNRA